MKNNELNKKTSIKSKWLLLIIIFILIINFIIGIGTYSDYKEITYDIFTNDISQQKFSNIQIDANISSVKGFYAQGGRVISKQLTPSQLNEIIILSQVNGNMKKPSIVNNSNEQINATFKSFSNTIALAINMFILFLLVSFVLKLISGEKLFSIAGSSSKNFTIIKNPCLQLSDVAGNEEAKESMIELVDFMKNPEKFKKYGAKIPRGTLLVGPPGTGKTYMAKALAGTAGVSVICVSASEFIEMYAGVGAMRVRKLFEEAKKNAPCIIFIDEIDAIGKKRGQNTSGSHDEQSQTLNELLIGMSGFNDNEGVIVLAATNRLEILDEALLRSGRFDRHISISLPDVSARCEILKIHSKNKPICSSVNLEEIAKMTFYMSGADLENVMNEASIYACKRDKGYINMEDINKAINKMIAGEEKQNRKNILPIDKEITAWHEAGHALASKMLTTKNVPKITIIPTTKGAGGYTLITPENERKYETKKDLLNEIAVSLAGRIAEEIHFGAENVTGGASQDFRHVTRITKLMIDDYGMSSEIGTINCLEMYGEGNSFLNAKRSDEAKKIIDEVYAKTKNEMVKQISILNEIAYRLLEKETIYEDELNNIVKHIA